MKNIILAGLYMVGLVAAYVDFILHGNMIVLLVSIFLFLVANGVCGYLDLGAKRTDMIGWAFLLVLAGLSAWCGYTRLGAEEAAVKTAVTVQLVLCGFFAILAISQVVVVSRTPAGAAHDHHAHDHHHHH